MQYSLTADYAANSQPFVTFQSGAAAKQTLEPHNHQQDHQDGDHDHDGYHYHDGDDDELPVETGFYRKRTHSNVLVERPQLGHNLTGQAFL